MIPTRNHYYYTIEETAKELPNKPTPEWVLKQIYDPDPPEINEYAGLYIIPSFYAEQPILVQRYNSAGQEKIRGWLDIEGIDDYCLLNAKEEDEDLSAPVCNGEICFEAQAKYPYLQRSIGMNCLDPNAGMCIDYYLLEALKVPFDKLFIRDDEIEHFKDHYYPVEHVVLETETQPIKKNTPDNTGRRDPYSLMTTIDACLQAFYWQYCERMPGGKSAIGEFVKFIDEQYKAKPKNEFMENIVDLKPKSKGDSKRFICLKARVCDKNPDGKKWHPWKAFDNQFRIAIKKFTPVQPTIEKNNP